MRFFFYSHDGMGLGHVRRHIAIAAALQEIAPEVHSLLATSVDEVASLGLPPNVDTLKLPGLRKIANSEYASRRLGIPNGHIRNLRSGVLLETVKAFQPDVILVDKHPFGADGELEPALAAARASGARLVLGLRDVLDDPAVVKKEWSRERLPERVGQYFELVLVYGLRSVLDPVRSCDLSAVIGDRAKYCGYVVNQAACTWCHDSCPHLNALEPVSRPSVLCTVGGGEDGFFLLKTFARACAEANWNGLAITGPMLPQKDLDTLRQIADETGLKLQPFVPCLPNAFWEVDALVCMGGYNTLVEALSKGLPTVCVPRISPRSEQLIRAAAFQELGLLQFLSPAEISPGSLNGAIDSALRQQRADLIERANRHLSFDGSHNAARYLLSLATSPRQNHSRSHLVVPQLPALAALGERL